MTSTTAIGIDIGGTGIKGGIVDLSTGELVSDRVKLATPKGGEPDGILEVTKQVLDALGGDAESNPVGVCFPAIVKNGRTMSAANISKKWVGLEAEKLFEKTLGRDILFVNDADAAGYAETEFGAAKDVDGLVILTTLGTGIGSALIYDGILVPNAELGHIEIDGHDAESRAAYSAKEREDLDWEHWCKRLTKYYRTVEFLFSPDLFVVGGGVSKHWDEFGDLIDIETKIVPAVHRNNAGILGAAALAARGHHRRTTAAE
ncbi:polyphosphate--glucose phosphotransferase [Humibacter ginsenosidimutans]|uniref:ROK family protein n=1 Tax=Humibacter ginsenosidimutans TaxID=2599293 RepID=A0A5B8M1J4_9MICO|nr:ROK family protein [Humibacter ginsenosidimutans]QDZ13901.1 ROK family protein [Humibacter ginsenosidimutans]